MQKRRILAAACTLILLLSLGTVTSAASSLPLSDFTGAMQGPQEGEVYEGGYIYLEFTSPAKGGMDGEIIVSDNLELEGFTSKGISFQLSAPEHVVCLFGDTVTYTYKVNAGAGEIVSAQLRGAESADGLGGLFAMADEDWEARVQEPQTGEQLPPAIIAAARRSITGTEDNTAPAGATIDIRFTSPQGGGLDGEIVVSDNLEFVGMRSEDIGAELSAEKHVVTLFGDPVTYTYRVNAEIGDIVSVELKNPMASDAQRRLYALPDQTWDAAVRAAVPEDFVSPPVQEMERPTLDGSYLQTPETARAGDCIEVTVTSPADGGLNGVLRTSANLTYEGSRGCNLGTELSTESRVTSLFGDGITYVYRVNAEAGDRIWVTLADTTTSDGECRVARLRDETWNCTVEDATGEISSAADFTAVMVAPDPDDLVRGGVIDVSFISPADGGMEGTVTTSPNLVFEGSVSAGNGAGLSSFSRVRSVLGDPVTYRYRVIGDVGEGAYIRLTDGKTADAGSRLSSRVRNQIWMGEIQEKQTTAIAAGAVSGLEITSSDSGMVITGLKATKGGSSVADLKSRLHTLEGLTLDVVSANGEPVSDEQTAGTGQVIRALNAHGNQAAAATLVIRGDVMGSGRLGIAQLTRLAAACTGQRPLVGVYQAAGDLNGNGHIDVGDLTQMAALLRS